MAITYGIKVAFKVLFILVSILVVILSAGRMLLSPYAPLLWMPILILLSIMIWMSLGIAIGILLRRLLLKQW